MSAIGRSFVSILVFVAVFLLSYWLLFAQIIPENLPGLASLAALLMAMVLAGLVRNGMTAETQGVLATTLTWAALVGAVGFSGGFLGPMIFAPDANQGPLLGLLITGPLGCAVGAVGGLVFSLWRWLHASPG